MSGSNRLAEFQQAAVDHIVSRLKDRRGSRRFLLADEVGLGKTIVARGVIDALAKGRRAPLKVVYLCSNSEIAEQNRSKLAAGGGTSVGRASELALQRPDSESIVELYAFTPGTSLSGGTGMAWERRLMLFLLHRVCDLEVSGSEWRKFFRCGASPERWMKSTEWPSVHSEFLYRTSTSFQDALRRILREPPNDTLIRSISEAVSSYADADSSARAIRNRLVGSFRGVVQRVALRSLQPDLVVLDEVQRFKDVIDEAKDTKRVASELFRQKVPVLILSATPYRFLTLEHEVRELGSAHHEDFFRTLDFLFGDNVIAPKRVRSSLAAFGEKLAKIDLSTPRDATLLSLKRSIEDDLRQVICRTERNWYFQDMRRSASEHGLSDHELPGREELREFFDIHRGLGPYLDSRALVTDFWKSAPSLLTFMDAGYALTRKLRERKVRVPRGLLSPADDATLPARNLRLRRLIDHTLGAANDQPLLWTRPSYTYHRDEAYGDRLSRKMLVFSGWRFVPKAIAVVVSNEAAKRLKARKEDSRQPLRFTEKWSFHVFDTCFPSWALASLVNVRAPLASVAPGTISGEELVESACKVLRARLTEVGVTVAPTGADRLWRAISRLEATSIHADVARFGLSQLCGPVDATTDATERHRDQFLAWLDDTDSIIRISESDLRHLARIAVASPAISLLRALLSVFDERDVSNSLPKIVQLCFGELRTYFNRPLVQQAIRRYTPKMTRRRRRGRVNLGFADRVITYALDHHLQAVLDEHTFLLRFASANATVSRTLDHYRSAWSLGRGSRRTNGRSGSGDRVRIGHDSHVWGTHFALAFGEEAAAESIPNADQEKRLRRSEVREAFNSPFWPFVLATTSVGQEGLDFHLHCRDIFHWNLPSNPVDLEQREGRINRRDCLAIRQSISLDWPLERMAETCRSTNGNPWMVIFSLLEVDDSGQRYKHGLYPHWIYECRDPARTVGIERHVAFFDASRDAHRYSRLKAGLALYRLVFGQVNQEHLLDDLEDRLEKLPEHERVRAQRRLSGYMLNLSPIGSAEALKFANSEALRLLESDNPADLTQLVDDVIRIVSNHQLELGASIDLIDTLITRVQGAVQSGNRKSHVLRKAVTALCYLRNPYDQFFDGQSVGGFDDDIRVLQEATRTGSTKCL